MEARSVKRLSYYAAACLWLIVLPVALVVIV